MWNEFSKLILEKIIHIFIAVMIFVGVAFSLLLSKWRKK